MSSTNAIQQASPRDLRSFGFTLAVGFAVVGLWPNLFHGQPVRLWSVCLGALFGVTATIVPNALRSARRAWLALGNVLGRINTGVILGVLFYGMVTPLRLMMKAAGRDPMNRAFDRSCESYRSPRQTRLANHMKNQF